MKTIQIKYWRKLLQLFPAVNKELKIMFSVGHFRRLTSRDEDSFISLIVSAFGLLNTTKITFTVRNLKL